MNTPSRQWRTRLAALGAVGVTAVGLGHVGLDVFADQRVDDILSLVQSKLPPDTSLTYQSVDGDPYGVGATIGGLRLRSPVFGELSVDELVVQGIASNDQGNLTGVDRLVAKGARAESPDGRRLSVSNLTIAGMTGEQLEGLLDPVDRARSLAALNVDEASAANLVIADGQNELEVAVVETTAIGHQRSTIELRDVRVRDGITGTNIAVDQAKWTGSTDELGLLAEALVDQSQVAAAAMQALPVETGLAGLTWSTGDARMTVARITSHHAPRADGRVGFNYEIDRMHVAPQQPQAPSLIGRLLPGEGLELSADGGGEHDPRTNVTSNRLHVHGERVGALQIEAEMRGLADLHEDPLNTSRDATALPPAILSALIDYRDAGLALAAIDGLAQSMGRSRAELAIQLDQFADIVLQGQTSPELAAIMAEIKEFIGDPASITVRVEPEIPMEIGMLAIAALINPSSIVELLGMTVQANGPER